MLLQKTRTGFPVWGNVFGNLLYNDPETYPSLFNYSFKTLPSVNIKEDDKVFTIEMAVPGKKKEDFKIDLDQRMLTISSGISEQQEENNTKYTLQEYSYASFKRSFRIPETVDTADISATYTDGILSVMLPKKEKEIKTITIS